MRALHHQISLELSLPYRNGAHSTEELAKRAANIVREFAHALPVIRRLLDSDITAAFLGDPAARSVDEVLLCYPGVMAAG